MSRFKGMYLTYDKVAMVYGQFPFPAWNDEDAKRGFIEGMLKKSERPQDFMLVKVGEYDTFDGRIKAIENGNNEFIMEGAAYVKEQEKVIDFPEREVEKDE